MSAGNIVLGVTRGIVCCADVVNLMKEVKEYADHSEGGSQSVRCASIFNRFLLLGFSVAEIALLSKGGQNNTLKNLKILELFPRGATLPLEICKVQEGVGGMGNSELVEKVFATLADVAQTASQIAVYEEKYYLEAFKKGELTTRPVYEYNHETERSEKVGEERIDPEKCSRTIKRYETLRAIATATRVVGENHVVSSAVAGARSLYTRLSNYLKEEELVNMDSIPPLLHTDAVFREWDCPITRLPIRYPVEDPNTGTVYERAAILRWLTRHPTSPLSPDQRLTPDMLITRRDLQLIIEVRLRFHQTRMQTIREG